jgi:hypothetical protein
VSTTHKKHEENPTNLIIKFQETSDKEKILRAPSGQEEEGKHVRDRGTKTRMTTDFSSEIMQAR